MLTLCLFIFTFTFILWNVKTWNKHNSKSRCEMKSTLGDSTSYSNPDTPNMGLWTILKMIGILIRHSRKDPTHQETANSKIYEYFKHCSTTYTKLKIKFLTTSVVFPNSATSIREFLSSEKCGNRVPETFRVLLTGNESKGLTFARHEVIYKEIRKYTISTLGKLGFGKNSSMSAILDDALTDFLDILETLRKDGGNKIQVHQLFSLCVTNIVWVTVGGQKFKENDETFLKLQNYVHKSFTEEWLTLICGYTFPKFVLDIMKWFGMKCQSLSEMYKKGSEIFLEHIEEIESRAQTNGYYENDFLNQFLLKVEKHKDDDKLSKIYSKSQLKTVLVELFAAAVDTTNKFMESFFMYMIMNPDIQDRLFLEIKEVIGDSSPSYSAHIKRMPYTQAVIAEIHRMVNILAAISRSAKDDCIIGNYTLKKNTVIVNMQAMINMDEAYWGDPKVFRPERFLDADNNVITEKVNYMIPYGAGSRVCPGENVAKATIFSLMVGILQRYTLMKGIKEEFVGLCKSLSTTNGPEPFHVSLFPR